MTRRPVLLITVLVLVALAAPLVAPYGPAERFRDHQHAPPMRVHVDAGGLYAHPLTLVDRLEQRFNADLSRRVALPWGTRDAAAPASQNKKYRRT